MFDFIKKIKEKTSFNKLYNSIRCSNKNNEASNGGCMGFSTNWKDTDDVCKKCPIFFENLNKQFR